MSEQKETLEKMLKKVKKLLSLAGNNPSQEEATAASLKAQELIAKYNLDLTDIEKETLEIGESEYRTGVDKSWKYGLASVVAKNFRCMVYWLDRRVAVFYGYKQDCAVASEVFGYLFKTGERGARRECKKHYDMYGTERGVYFSYTRGFTAGLQSALEKQSTALMVIVPQEVKDEYGKMSEDKGMKSLGGSGTVLKMELIEQLTIMDFLMAETQPKQEVLKVQDQLKRGDVVVTAETIWKCSL